MRRSTLLIALVLFFALPTVVLAQNDSTWTVKSALKQIDKAVAEMRGLKGEVQWDEVLDSRTVQGSGTFHLSFAGNLRAEIAGSSARTVLITPLYLHVYKPHEELAQTYYLPSQPELLAQYVMIGFVPTGTALNKRFKVSLVREEQLEGRDVLVFTLIPKGKKKDQPAISVFTLWIDTSTWLPVQQLVRHNASGMQVTVRYVDLTSEDDLPSDLFRPDWPAGTKTVKP